jgi:hypothetical protein
MAVLAHKDGILLIQVQVHFKAALLLHRHLSKGLVIPEDLHGAIRIALAADQYLADHGYIPTFSLIAAVHQPALCK